MGSISGWITSGMEYLGGESICQNRKTTCSTNYAWIYSEVGEAEVVGNPTPRVCLTRTLFGLIRWTHAQIRKAVQNLQKKTTQGNMLIWKQCFYLYKYQIQVFTYLFKTGIYLASETTQPRVTLWRLSKNRNMLSRLKDYMYVMNIVH